MEDTSSLNSEQNEEYGEQHLYQGCPIFAMEGRVHAGFHSNVSLHLLISLIPSSSLIEDVIISKISWCSDWLEWKPAYSQPSMAHDWTPLTYTNNAILRVGIISADPWIQIWSWFSFLPGKPAALSPRILWVADPRWRIWLSGDN